MVIRLVGELGLDMPLKWDPKQNMSILQWIKASESELRLISKYNETFIPH